LNQKNRYILLFLAIILLATALRFYALDDRVFHHDEGVHGYLTYKLFKNGEYHYDPTYHGPFLYYSTAAVFTLFGDSNFTARLLPAAAGVLLIVLIYRLRDQLGESGALFAAAMIAISPSFLYYSRFFRNDIYIAFFSLLFVVSAVKYLKHGRYRQRLIYVCTGAVAGALALSSKENAYIIAGIFAFFVLGYLITKKEINAMRAVDALLFALISFVVFALFYTNFLTNPDALISVIPAAINHWAEMHRIERIGGHWSFYLPILVRYELPIVLLAIAGGIYYVKKRNVFMIFLLYWGVTSLLVYSYLQEKVPWLVLHILPPLALIAGAYLGELLPSLNKRPRAIGTAVIIILVLSAGLFIHQSLCINYYENTDSDEITIRGIPVHGLIYVQTTSDVLDTVGFIEARVRDDPNTSITIARSDSDIVIVPVDDVHNITLDWRYSKKVFTLRPGYDMAMYYYNPE
jgi:uncharacterized protein (TIGR03663 family)